MRPYDPTAECSPDVMIVDDTRQKNLPWPLCNYPPGSHLLIPGKHRDLFDYWHEAILIGAGVHQIFGRWYETEDYDIVHVYKHNGVPTIIVSPIQDCANWQEARCVRYLDEPEISQYLAHGKSVKAVNRVPDNPDVVLARALSAVGFQGYSLITKNCGHFAFWAKTGEKLCVQIEARPLFRSRPDVFITLNP